MYSNIKCGFCTKNERGYSKATLIRHLSDAFAQKSCNVTKYTTTRSFIYSITKRVIITSGHHRGWPGNYIYTRVAHMTSVLGMYLRNAYILILKCKAIFLSTQHKGSKNCPKHNSSLLWKCRKTSFRSIQTFCFACLIPLFQPCEWSVKFTA